MSENTGRNSGRVENLRPWKPGQSGNPGGRPKDSAKRVREELQGEPIRLIAALLEIAENPKETGNARVSAIRELWSRGWGTPASFAAVEGHDPLGMSPVDEELTQLAAAMEKERHELLAARDEIGARRNARGVPEDPSEADTVTG